LTTEINRISKVNARRLILKGGGDGTKMYYLFIKKYCKNKDWIKYAEKHERKEIDVTCDRSNRKRTKDPSQQIQRGVVPSWLLSP